MRLSDAANRFNRMPCFDGYTGAPLFKAQLALFDDTKRDSETAVRRVLSVSAQAALPARRVVRAGDARFIIGHANPDDFGGSTIRVGYVAQEAPVLATVRTLGQLCRNEAGLQAWAGRVWVKDHAFTEQGSTLDPSYHIHFAAGESVPDDSLVEYLGVQHIVRTSNLGPAGTLATYCDELRGVSVETASIVNGEYDPVTDAVGGAPTPVRVVRIRWQSLFRYSSGSAPTFGPADMQVAVAKAALTPRVGARLTLSDGDWLITSADSRDDVWLCRATRHG